MPDRQDMNSHSLFVKVDSVMSQTSSVSTTSGMFSVLANTAMTVADMSTKLPRLCEPGRL